MTNELTTTTTTQTAPSIFDNMNDFRDSLKMAEVLCRTQLIPQNFQNKPADCLVALEYARRLNVPPTAILPHLYVIHGRPSMSSQMMIGLVNRSGLFSRITWEEGVDGVLEYSENGRAVKIENCYAVAYFTELATGKEFKSPRVDLRLAYRNGWYQKDGSKWRSIPTIMARYRSASMLIKSVCPELALGMDFTEDALDETPARVNPGAVHTVTLTADDVSYSESGDDVEPSEAARMIIEINQCETLEELAKLGDEIANALLSEVELEHLRETYLNRKKFLTAEKQKAQPATEPEPKPEPKPAAKKTRARKTTPEPVEAVEAVEAVEPVDEDDARKNQSIELLQEGMEQIANCHEVKLLQVNAVASIQKAVDEGNLLEQHAKLLRARIQERIGELEDEARA